MTKEITPQEYLDKDFDYTKLTKLQLRKIMYENGVEEIPPISALKSDLLEAYKRHIHDRVGALKKRSRVTMENPFQRGEEPRTRVLISQREKEGSPKKKEAEPSPAKEAPSREPFIHKGPRTEPLDRTEKHHRASLSSDESIPGTDRSLVSSSLFNSFLVKDSAATGGRRRDMASEGPAMEEGELTMRTPRKLVKKVSKAVAAAPEAEGKRARKRFLFVGILVGVLLYLRLYCPYCDGSRMLCIAPPRHSVVVDGELVCSEGYMIRSGILGTYCVRDDTREREVAREVRRIKRLLEGIHGDYAYGMAPRKAVPLESLTADPQVVAGLRDAPGVVIEEEMVYSTGRRVRLKSFLRYYAELGLMVLVPLAVAATIAKVFQARARRGRERAVAARKIVKDIADVLIRQIYVSAKNANYSGYVYVEQLHDCFGTEAGVWEEVEKLVARNSNIREVVGREDKRAWEWVGPILYKPEFSSVF
jgi:hypothetical protein